MNASVGRVRCSTFIQSNNSYIIIHVFCLDVCGVIGWRVEQNFCGTCSYPTRGYRKSDHQNKLWSPPIEVRLICLFSFFAIHDWSKIQRTCDDTGLLHELASCCVKNEYHHECEQNVLSHWALDLLVVFIYHIHFSLMIHTFRVVGNVSHLRGSNGTRDLITIDVMCDNDDVRRVWFTKISVSHNCLYLESWYRYACGSIVQLSLQWYRSRSKRYPTRIRHWFHQKGRRVNWRYSLNSVPILLVSYCVASACAIF